MKFKKEDLEDLFYDLKEKASEHYDNALDGISFENDNIDIIFPLNFLIYNYLPEDFELNIPDKVVDWYKNKPWGVCLSDVLKKEGLITANHEYCGDNRFKVIEKAKEAILESTNIESSPEEMAVLDNFLFRCWQMGWLKKYEENN